jgi:arylsulfatase A-like enzyme
MWKRNDYHRMDEQQRAAWDAAYGPKNQAFRDARLQGRDLVRWKYQRYIKDYLRTIASVDDNLGRVLDYLDRTGLANNTIVIYASDQGFYLGDHGWYDKRFIYEPNLDWAPTMLELAGVPVPDDMQGRSLVPLLQGHRPDDWRESVYYHYYEFLSVHMVNRHYGARTARYKIVPVGHYETPHAFQGDLSDIRIYWGTLGQDELRQWAQRRN